MLNRSIAAVPNENSGRENNLVGISGSSDRRSMKTKATPRITAATSTAIARAEPQPHSSPCTR
ncbi:Uncharacterised protein [Mycobacteroides abscessus subsp. abscessus]|nr:Uncharacterised protein [Mycobacteroides abscessus subsp. abscessus]